ncbi:MAG TPA: ADP-ribosylglycohydrolase family protein, partial [Clostridia bacterium]|nr:ADP-ribosylglycohydrolase family protein [Clostridia bacterium]
LWACLAPGDPGLAIRLAREDACADHCADGVDACLFLTAIQSAAFFERDFDRLFSIGMEAIAGNARMARAFEDTVRWWRSAQDWRAVREMILTHYPSPNWTDVTINLCFILLAWLAGASDF